VVGGMGHPAEELKTVTAFERNLNNLIALVCTCVSS